MILFLSSKKQATVAFSAWLLFVLPAAAFVTKRLQFQSRLESSSSLAVLPKGSPSPDDNKNSTFRAFALPLTLVSVASLGVRSANAIMHSGDALIEAEVLTDVSHLGLDLAAFLGPGTLALRIAVVIGRVCSITADYLPDHAILPEELLFQGVTLAAALLGLFKAITFSLYSATAKNVTMRDGKAFVALFAPAGTSWAQFKAVLAVCALDWITMDAGDSIGNQDDDDGNEYLYWVYSGNVEVESREGTSLYRISRKSSGNCKQVAARGLVGERLLLRPTKKTPPPPRFTVKATTKSTILRIHAPSIKLLMDNDHQFEDSIRTLIFQGMEAKLSGQFESAASTAAWNTTTGTITSL